MSRPIVRKHQFVKTPFRVLKARVTSPFRSLVRPIAESIGEAIDEALEPVTTAASPLAGALDPIRDAVQEGLGDADFVQGLSNLGFDEDARSVADAASDFFVVRSWKTLPS